MVRNTVCVVTPRLGARSQVWSWRQLVRFSRVRPTVLTWARENLADFPMGDVSVHLAGSPEDPQEGVGRWLWRARTAASGNFYGTHGSEKQRFASLFRREKVSAVLCHFGQTALRMLPAADVAGIPLVAHFHGLDISSSLRNRWYRLSLENAIGRFAAVICVGSEQRQRILEFCIPEERIHLIPCGVPTEEFRPFPRNSTDSITFICISRLVEWKGVHHTIGAYARIASELPKSRLVVVGDGPESRRLQDLVEGEGISKHVKLMGAQSEAQVRELLQCSDVFLQHSLNHPSGWYEGFGVSIAEASATGLPVVVSACGGVMDQVVDGVTGTMVPQRDEEAMAAAMLRLASDPKLRAQMGSAGRERMIECFDTQDQVAKLEQVLLDVGTAA